jgi:hypothetical protein
LRSRAARLETARPGAALIFLDLMTWRVPSGSRRWIEGMNALVNPRTADAGPVLALYADSGKLLGEDPIRLRPAEVRRLEAAQVDWPLDGWGVDELGRVVLLLGAANYLAQAELERLVTACYHAGDARARQAVLRALPLLPRPERFRAVALDGCHSADPHVFEAIACDNPYPSRHLPALTFRHLVQRAIAAGVREERIVGLMLR